MEDFFALIYGQGMRAIAFKKPADKGFRHAYFASNEDAAKFAREQDSRGMVVYHACATFTTSTSRKADNAAMAKAFWLDLDCGTDKPYRTQADAVGAVKHFCSAVGMPTPALVSSGGGIHCYWFLSNGITPAQWTAAASLLKSIAAHVGLHADPTRTADLASVLRPPGTRNLKHNKIVSVLRSMQPVDYIDFYKTLTDFAHKNHIAADSLGAPPSHVIGFTSDTSLADNISSGPPVQIEKVALNCGVVAKLKETKGNLTEPQWYHAIGVVAFCEGGRETAHEWSKGHPAYSETETDRKLDQLEGKGPTTCEVLKSHFPDECAACPFYGKIKSPINLGQGVATEEREAKATDEEEGKSKTYVLNPEGMPRDYRVMTRNNVTGLYKQKLLEDDDGNSVVDWMLVSPSVFYPERTIYADGAYEMEIRSFYRNMKKTRLFRLRNSIVGSGGKELASALAGSANIIVNEKARVPVSDYLRQWLEYHDNERDPVNTYTRYGWHGDSFVVGDTTYRPDGTTDTVLLDGGALNYSSMLKPRGKLDVWVDTIDKLYNHQGLEGLQFYILCAFASPLVPLLTSTGGLLVYGHSDQSGVGKTTAGRATLSVWGAWEGVETAHSRTTDNAFNSLMGTMCNLPVMIDEMTNIRDYKVSDFVHSISQGQSRARLRRDGTPNTKAKTNWQTIVISSGNTRLYDKLAATKAHAEAEMVRVFEFTLPSLSTGISVAQSNDYINKLEKNNGVAGVEYIKYVTANKDKITTLLADTQIALDRKFQFKPSERYWARLVTVTTVAHIIAKKLGLIHFDVARLQKWIGETLDDIRTETVEETHSTENRFADLRSALSPAILITTNFQNNSAPAFVVYGPRVEIEGRIILPDTGQLHSTTSGSGAEFAIKKSAIRDWCNENSVSFRQLISDLKASGDIIGEDDKYHLAKGITEHSGIGRQRVYLFNPELIKDNL